MGALEGRVGAFPTSVCHCFSEVRPVPVEGGPAVVRVVVLGSFGKFSTSRDPGPVDVVFSVPVAGIEGSVAAEGRPGTLKVVSRRRLEDREPGLLAGLGRTPSIFGTVDLL